MFLLSGLFVANSLQRKGAGKFLRDRVIRLAIPFAVAAAVIAPLAYYPAYLTTGGDRALGGFWRQWLALGYWPAGPAWFVWVLLVFDVVPVALYLQAPKWSGFIERLSARPKRQPAVFFWLLVVASACVYIPMVVTFGPEHWTPLGPFHFQTGRIFHYLVYFLGGVGIGACGIERGLLAPDGALARRWRVWAAAMPLAFALVVVFTLSLPALARTQPPIVLGLIGGPAFELSCAASSFGFLALFIRFASGRSRFFDSLSSNEYGIYLTHYPFVSWLQYALLGAALPAVGKAVVVFLGAAILSWTATVALRRIPAVSRVI
jgi:hypothetical protein